MSSVLNYSQNQDLVIEAHSVHLVRLNQTMLETVRQWRNSPEISKFMNSQEHISQEAQQKWFNKVRFASDRFYFVIYHTDTPIGLCSIFDIDYEKGESDSGIYIANEKYLNSGYAIKAIFALADFSFDTLKLNKWKTTIKNCNKKAIRLDTLLGYKKTREIDSETAEYVLNKNDYLEKRSILYDTLKNYV